MGKLISISEAQKQLPRLISRVGKHVNKIIITVKGKPKAVLISTNYLESLEETIEVLSIPEALESIIESQKQIKNGEFVFLSDLK